MAISYTQTDTTAGCDPAGTDLLKDADEGGTAGSTEVTISVAAGTNEWDITCNLNPAGTDITWDSGVWTDRCEVTTANMDLAWGRTRVVRYNSSCASQETLFDEALASAISFTTTGVKSDTSGTRAGTTSEAAGDEAVWQLRISNANSMKASDGGITPSQDIDSPFTAAVGGGDGTDMPWPGPVTPPTTMMGSVSY